MQKLIIFLFAMLSVSCSLQKKTVENNTNTAVKSNENGNIIWADGGNEKFYMPESKNTIAFILQHGLVIYNKGINSHHDNCNYYYRDNAKIKICPDGETILFRDGMMINSGFTNMHNSYQ